MKFLLDTRVFLWMLAAPEKIATRAREAIEDAENQLWLSAASIWEIGVKYRESKLLLPVEPRHYVPAQMARHGVDALDVKASHVIQCAELSLHHRDQFDRMLIAQSLVEKMPILTGDTIFKRYKAQVLWE